MCSTFCFESSVQVIDDVLTKELVEVGAGVAAVLIAETSERKLLSFRHATTGR